MTQKTWSEQRLLGNGTDRCVQCGVVTDLQFVKKKKNAVSAKHSKAEHNKMRFACIGGNWTLCFYICVVYLFDSWFLYSVVSAKRMGMCSAYVLCPSTSRIIGDIIMPCINICFFYFLLICSVLFFMWVVPFHFFKKKILFFRAVLGSQQNRAESTVIFFIRSLPHTCLHAPECCICYSWWTNSDTSLSPRVHRFTLGFTLVTRSVGFDKQRDMNPPL